MELKKERNSSIELVKIIAIFLIVISHVTQTLISPDIFKHLNFSDGFFIIKPTTNISEFGLMIFRYFGALGNLIFIISSSYFLSNTEHCNKKKVLKLGINTVIISLIFLTIYLICNVHLRKTEIISALFPISHQCNWFITLYLVFIMMIPYLNIIIKKLNQKQLFRLSCSLVILYFIIAFVVENSFGLNNLIVLVSIYFIVNYSKRYMESFWNSKKKCIILLILGIVSLIALQLLTNFIGLNTNLMHAKQLRWVVNNNPILLLIALSLFYLFKQMSFKNKIINTISSLSLYIYLTHENLLFRNYTRAYIWHFIYEKFGYSHIIVKIILYAFLLFIIASAVSYIYSITLGKIIDKLMEKVFPKLKTAFNKIENKLLKLNK